MSSILRAAAWHCALAYGLLEHELVMNKINKTTKLTLHTETVRMLDRKQLGAIAGGGENTVGGPYETKITACWVCKAQ